MRYALEESRRSTALPLFPFSLVFFSVFQAKCSFDEHYLVFVSVVFFAKCLKVTLSRSATKTACWKPSDESHSLDVLLLWEGGEGGEIEESFHVTEG